MKLLRGMGVITGNPLTKNKFKIMKDTEKRRMFIISFGDSRKYKVTVEADGKDGTLAPFVRTEKELNRFLADRFPGETFAYYTTPRLTEVSPEHADKYSSYPEFDDKAVAEVKRELVREIKVMNDNRELNANDPWGTGVNDPGFDR